MNVCLLYMYNELVNFNSECKYTSHILIKRKTEGSFHTIISIYYDKQRAKTVKPDYLTVLMWSVSLTGLHFSDSMNVYVLS